MASNMYFILMWQIDQGQLEARENDGGGGCSWKGEEFLLLARFKTNQPTNPSSLSSGL